MRRVDLNSLQIQTGSLRDPGVPNQDKSLKRRRRGRNAGARAQFREPGLWHSLETRLANPRWAPQVVCMGLKYKSTEPLIRW
eukprot:4746950-Pyramimonas_sp.AAC.1